MPGEAVAIVKTVAVWGVQGIGAGVAQMAALGGWRVLLCDSDAGAAERCKKTIVDRLAHAVQQDGLTEEDRSAALDRIRASHGFSDLADVDVAIELAVEDLATKQSILERLEAVIRKDAVLATHSSLHSVEHIAATLRDSSRVVGIHFHSPAHKIPVVEVVAAESTRASSVVAAVDVVRAWGKKPIQVTDAPGYVVDRLMTALYLEAIRLVDEGVGGVDEIDLVFKTHGGFGLGPFERMDIAGLDAVAMLASSIGDRIGEVSRFDLPATLGALESRGYHGRKTGRGFYGYGGPAPLPACPVDRRSFELSPLLADAMTAVAMRGGAVRAGSTEQYIVSRVLSAWINEAGHVYSEGVASSDDIDLAMREAAGLPRGPLALADEIGHRSMRGFLHALEGVVGLDRYHPADLFARAQ